MASYARIKAIARELRKHQTNAEERVWQIVRGKRICGAKFLRQHPIIYEMIQYDYHFFVADFYCDKHKLVIEIDGKYHEYQKRKDYQRDLILNKLGLKTIRFKNEETKHPEKI